MRKCEKEHIVAFDAVTVPTILCQFPVIRQFFWHLSSVLFSPTPPLSSCNGYQRHGNTGEPGGTAAASHHCAASIPSEDSDIVGGRRRQAQRGQIQLPAGVGPRSHLRQRRDNEKKGKKQGQKEVEENKKET